MCRTAAICELIVICVAAQFQGVQWMLRRERDLGPRRHPTVRDLTAAVGAPLFVCAATGAAEVTAPPDIPHCRGGFFCDEPVRSRQ